MSVALVSALASPARADGGQSIASATGVVYGTPQFGNTVNGAHLSTECYYRSYWSLSVTAGDHVTIDWEVSSTAQAYMRMGVLPVGTTDFNAGTTDLLYYWYLNSNLKAESTFDAPVTGIMPLQFRSCDDDSSNQPGPYDFTAYVTHVVIPSLSVTSRIPLKGSLAVTANNPDGAPITSGLIASIQVKTQGQAWQTVGNAAMSAAPTQVPYQIPKSLSGQRVSLRVVVSGAGYTTKGTTGQRVDVGPKAKVTLRVADPSVPRLQRARLIGKATGFPTGAKVTIKQRQASGGGWTFEGNAKVGSDHMFRYSEVVHSGDRYYRACLGGLCSDRVLVRVIT